MAALTDLGPIKLMGLLQRKAGTDLNAFRQHWRTAHKDEALKLKHFMTAYNQNHRRPEVLSGLKPVADGCPEIWFRSIEEVVAMQTSDEYMTGAYVDEPNFMEGRAQGLVLSESVLVPGPTAMPSEDMVRVSVFLKQAPSIDGHAFADWLANASNSVMTLNGAPMRHTRSISLAAREDMPLFEGVESYWWPDMASFETAWGAGEFAEGAGSYLDISACAGLLTQEERVLWPSDGLDYSA